jgi:hypothetical protein
MGHGGREALSLLCCFLCGYVHAKHVHALCCGGGCLKKLVFTPFFVAIKWINNFEYYIELMNFDLLAL